MTELEAFEFGYEEGINSVWNECMYYLSDGKRKTIPYEFIKRYEPKYPESVKNRGEMWRRIEELRAAPNPTRSVE